ncbi:MAG: hypothetical protein J1E38_07650 [Paramuribaculum sp.]|nr:hypothetical protein [Paramuribaculum sp.]
MSKISVIGFYPWVKYICKAHIFNPFWVSASERRRLRESARLEYKTHYLEKYLPFIKSLKVSDNIPNPYLFNEDKIFSFWAQGLDGSPHIVRQCIDSIKNQFGERFIFLTSNNLKEYVDIPEFILHKFNSGKISYAHLSDIFRLELLYKYGGYWFDATDFVTGDIWDNIKKADFFMFRSSDRMLSHMFVMNSFIRGKKGDPLTRMWVDLLYEYWKNEDIAIEYFFAHMLFRLLVTHNDQAKELFKKMPVMEMDPTHVLWHEIGNHKFDYVGYEKMKSNAFFQKCSYKPQRRGVNSLIPGSFAEVVINDKTHK